MSASHFTNLTWTKFMDCSAEFRDKRKKIGQTICLSPKNNNSERPIVKPLLFWQALVNRDQYIEATGHGIKQGTIIEITPTHLRGCLHFVR